MRERVLITGGSGFIGAALARQLITAGHDVHLLLRPGYCRWRLAGLEGAFTPHRADLHEPAAVRRAIARCRPEVIYHLAAHGTLPNNPDRATVLATSIAGTANLLEALADTDYQALVHAGSSSEYGHKDRPMRPTDRLEPRTDYAIAKAAATHLVLAAAYRGRPACVVRIFSAYGPWEDPARLASSVMGCCRRGERPKVTGGNEPRDFIHVDDVAELLRLAAHQPRARGQVLHAGTGQVQTVRDMVEAIVACSGGPPAEYGAQPPRPDEPARWQASIERTTSLTGWQPRLGLRDGVAQMWDWFCATAAGRDAA